VILFESRGYVMKISINKIKNYSYEKINEANIKPEKLYQIIESNKDSELAFNIDLENSKIDIENLTFCIDFVKQLAKRDKVTSESIVTINNGNNTLFSIKKTNCLKSSAKDSNDEESTYACIDYINGNTPRLFIPKSGKERPVCKTYLKGFYTDGPWLGGM
jgi:hypothetical protein